MSNPPVADGVIGVCSCPVNSSQIVFWMRSFSPSELGAGFLSKGWCARVYHGLRCQRGYLAKIHLGELLADELTNSLKLELQYSVHVHALYGCMWWRGLASGLTRMCMCRWHSLLLKEIVPKSQ